MEEAGKQKLWLGKSRLLLQQFPWAKQLCRNLQHLQRLEGFQLGLQDMLDGLCLASLVESLDPLPQLPKLVADEAEVEQLVLLPPWLLLLLLQWA